LEYLNVGKVLKIAAVVVSVAAAIPSGGTSLLAAGLSVSGTVASAIALGVTFAATLLTKPSGAGSGTQTEWVTDPKAPSPIIYGRTLVGGNMIYRKTNGNDNDFQHIIAVLSGCGPVEEIEKTYLDTREVFFDGSGAVTGFPQVRLYQVTQLGECPESGYLNRTISAGSPHGTITQPDWTSAHKLSGYAAVLNVFWYDDGGDYKFLQLPSMRWTVKGVKCYDPRLDSTYPGGSGSCRYNDQGTWVFSENGFIQGLTTAIGWFQGDDNIRVGGIGMPITSIDIASFVECANIADANGWKSGGRLTSANGKWDTLKALCKAGGGEPVRLGATLSCIVNAPRTSIATITRDDIAGDCNFTTSQTRRDRINGIIAVYRSEDHLFEAVPAGVVRNATYLAQDGQERTKEITYGMVQCEAGETPDQVAQIAAYDIANAREAGPCVMPLKIRWLGYRSGDKLTIDDDPIFGYMRGKDVIVLQREFDGNSGVVTLTVREETDAKHTWALSQVGVPAPTTDENTAPSQSLPEDATWTVSRSVTTLEGVPSGTFNVVGASVPIRTTGYGFIIPNLVTFHYREYGSTDWTSSASITPDPDRSISHTFTGLDSAKIYEVGVSYLNSDVYVLGTYGFSASADSTTLTADNNFLRADKV
jgi:hypothetical protein